MPLLSFYLWSRSSKLVCSLVLNLSLFFFHFALLLCLFLVLVFVIMCVIIIMVSLPHQCPGVEGKVCNRFLPAKGNDPHHLCTSCCGKTCSSDDRCEECHDCSDERWQHVGEYIDKLSLHREKKGERKAKASSTSFSFSGYSPAMPVPQCQLLSPSGSGIVTTTPSLSSVCTVTYSGSATCHLRCPVHRTVGCHSYGARPQATSC